MAKFDIGDLVVLKSGSMRMCVEATDGDAISCVWCNEGAIGRDTFDVRLLNKWEVREDSGPRERRGPPRDRDGDDRPARKPYDRDRGGDDRPARKPRASDRDGDERPARKTGWDGKPREKKYYRKDD
ncbi:DUF2158 domain-containing protein [Limibaculum sp. M0105]|uniref:DUF2158 domain-containing protein n=1 Tax=Thermohalobaculum xanthum TaxID=2753746 RepID=A0A8J7SGZ7_9RHOB|nr:DUF2158 domain-containing protein [Thermohalobaculum xanthum]MBK0400467.1 DUF2158 domain-containing protein [Thermohalobaculum xanthum]